MCKKVYQQNDISRKYNLKCHPSPLKNRKALNFHLSDEGKNLRFTFNSRKSSNTCCHKHQPAKEWKKKENGKNTSFPRQLGKTTFHGESSKITDSAGWLYAASMMQKFRNCKQRAISSCAVPDSRCNGHETESGCPFLISFTRSAVSPFPEKRRSQTPCDLRYL
jgi:hypothetical protein